MSTNRRRNDAPTGSVFAGALAAECVVVLAIFAGAIVLTNGGPLVSTVLERLLP